MDKLSMTALRKFLTGINVEFEDDGRHIVIPLSPKKRVEIYSQGKYFEDIQGAFVRTSTVNIDKFCDDGSGSVRVGKRLTYAGAVTKSFQRIL